MEITIRGQLEHDGWTAQLGEGPELVNRFKYRVRFGRSTWSGWVKIHINVGSGPGHFPVYSDALDYVQNMMRQHSRAHAKR